MSCGVETAESNGAVDDGQDASAGWMAGGALGGMFVPHPNTGLQPLPSHTLPAFPAMSA